MFSFTSAANPSCVAVEKSLRTSELLPSRSLFKFESPLRSLHFQAGLQITDYVHHSNETSKRESIISVGEAVPLHPTHTQWKKSRFGRSFALPHKVSLGAADLLNICF